MTPKLELFIEYAWAFIGTPYYFGGDDPISGFDCSGVTSECLRAFGFIGCKERLNSGQIWAKWKGTRYQVSTIRRGCLLLFGKMDGIVHVAIAIDARSMLEAGGGDHLTDTTEEQSIQNAFVRVRPIAMRSDYLGCIDLFVDERV